MDLSIAAFLTQDGVTNGAIYALLALSLVLVFTVTRVIFVPAGEFVAYGTLTLAALQSGKAPGTLGLLVGLAVAAGLMELVASIRSHDWRRLPHRLAFYVAMPLCIAGLVSELAALALPLAVQIVVTLAVV